MVISKVLIVFVSLLYARAEGNNHIVSSYVFNDYFNARSRAT